MYLLKVLLYKCVFYFVHTFTWLNILQYRTMAVIHLCQLKCQNIFQDHCVTQTLSYTIEIPEKHFNRLTVKDVVYMNQMKHNKTHYLNMGIFTQIVVK